MAKGFVLGVLLVFLFLAVGVLMVSVQTMAEDPNIVAVEGTFQGWAIDTYRRYMLD
mgnify:CR=1 FL=1